MSALNAWNIVTVKTVKVTLPKDTLSRSARLNVSSLSRDILDIHRLRTVHIVNTHFLMEYQKRTQFMLQWFIRFPIGFFDNSIPMVAQFAKLVKLAQLAEFAQLYQAT